MSVVDLDAIEAGFCTRKDVLALVAEARWARQQMAVVAPTVVLDADGHHIIRWHNNVRPTSFPMSSVLFVQMLAEADERQDELDQLRPE